jgi:hypothetical protein
MKRDEPPSPQIVKTDKGLKPYRAWDAEALMADPVGTIYEAKPYSPRKAKGHRTYWLALKRVVQATDKWPDVYHLHQDLRLACGYFRKAYSLKTGEEILVPDSVAFDKMNQKEFAAYTQRAMMVLSEAVGFDVMDFLEEQQ